MDTLEDDASNILPDKTRRIDDKMDVLTVPRKQTTLNLGAKSFSGREVTRRRKWEDTIGIVLGQLEDNEKDGSGHSQGNLRPKDKKCINTQTRQ